VGIKESSGNVQLVSEIIRLCRPEFSVLTGSSGSLFYALLTGATGGILALACFLPEAAIELYEAVRAGDTARARKIQMMLLGPSRKITGELGPTGVKYAMDCLGYWGGQPRPPLLPLTAEQKQTVESVVAEWMARQRVGMAG
jgi:4-hydroxy-2-oxoglutarate aldolase